MDRQYQGDRERRTEAEPDWRNGEMPFARLCWFVRNLNDDEINPSNGMRGITSWRRPDAACCSRSCCSVSPFDPYEAKHINTSSRRSASKLRAEQQSWRQFRLEFGQRRHRIPANRQLEARNRRHACAASRLRPGASTSIQRIEYRGRASGTTPSTAIRTRTRRRCSRGITNRAVTVLGFSPASRSSARSATPTPRPSTTSETAPN